VIIKTYDGAVLETDEIVMIGKLYDGCHFDIIFRSGLTCVGSEDSATDADFTMNRTVLIVKWLDKKVPTSNMEYFIS
jgi:hypothetical protein